MAERDCTGLARDIERIANIAAKLAHDTSVPGGMKRRADWTMRGTFLGPKGGEVHYTFSCPRPMQSDAFGPGTCASYRLDRDGPGVGKAGLRPYAHTGNLYGFVTQLSRDAAKIWSCPPADEHGFQGARRRRR